MPNLLAHETSPYLLQHKDNPVDWRSWGPETLALARREDKPILLSIGYAACHWCHVMAHESFEDADTAAVMNELFVNVKVDREERPDLDTIYQSALALLGQQGGWPLTMFLDPDGRPFWGGTYFPPVTRWGRPGFTDVLHQVAQVYRTSPERIAGNIRVIDEAMASLSRPAPGDPPSLDALDGWATAALGGIDPVHGGFGTPPKFPQPSFLSYLWRAHLRTGAAPLAQAVTLTLDHICEGGIYDHLGGGFARYSTDAAWLVPHFEKMLYDNAQILELLGLVWRRTGNRLYRQRIDETLAWVEREMIAADAFAASLDADSEGEEGRFYVWDEPGIDGSLAPLGAERIAEFKLHYDVRPGGNWEGRTILNRLPHMDPHGSALETRLAECRALLFQDRAPRTRPGWDDKVLADWNGLMVAAFTVLAGAFDRPALLDRAQAAFAFVAGVMTDGGRLRHVWRLGRPTHPATLDDHANMARAALLLYEATADETYIDRAVAWTDELDRRFWDADGGTYHFTAADTGDLIARTKSAIDNAVPAGNGTMIEVLARLWHLTGETRYRDRAETSLRAWAGELTRNPLAFSTLLNGWEHLLSARQVGLVGEPGEPGYDALHRACATAATPCLTLRHLDPLTALPRSHPAHGKTLVDGAATAYVCIGETCSPPVTDPAALADALAR
jgi:uncharacterized protein